MKKPTGILDRPGIARTIRAIYKADRVTVGKVEIGKKDDIYPGKEQPMQIAEIANGWTIPYKPPY